MQLYHELSSYTPKNEQEQQDLSLMLRWLSSGEPVFERSCRSAHFTASSWVVSPDRKQVLMIYHNLYNSWAWMGGHADGEEDLYSVARREIQEESGLTRLSPVSRAPISVEILTVDGHIKCGQYVSSHLHLNVTYLFEADPNDALRIKPDENSGVQWFSVEKLPEIVSEPWMMQHIYPKLIAEAKRFERR